MPRKCSLITDLLASYDLNGQLTALEDLIAQGADRRMILRMLVLASITSGGIRSKLLENLKREVLQVRPCSSIYHCDSHMFQTYGYEILPTLLALENLQLLHGLPMPQSLLRLPSMKLAYPGIRKQLRLLLEESEAGSDAMPYDISYVYSGYAPLSVRLVQCVAQMNGVLANFGGGAGGPAQGTGKGKGKGKDVPREDGTMPMMNAHPIVGWKGFEDVVAGLPGATVDISQKGDGSGFRGPSCQSRLLAHPGD
jgi:vacuolar protein sorting-associated protein 33A